MIFVLVVNDFFLKPGAPSWLSGKLSDMVIVYLLPFLGLAIIALIPKIFHQRWIAFVAFLLPVLIFTAGKIIFSVNGLIFHLLSVLLPFQTHFVFDPSDLLSLIILLPAILVWRKSGEVKHLTPIRLRWVTLPLVAILTLADAAAPQYGIACLEAQLDGSLLAQTLYQHDTFVSSDNGLNWDPAPEELRIQKECGFNFNHPGDIKIFESVSGMEYRFIAGQKIAESSDNGQHWTEVLPLKMLSEAELAFRKKTQSPYTFVPGPLDIIEDPGSGNLIVAMGQEGIVLRQSQGEWLWVTVGSYDHQTSLRTLGFNSLFSLLWVEWLLCLTQAIFLISLFNLKLHKRWWRIVKVALGWIGWGLLLLFAPAKADSYILPLLQGLAVPVALVWALLCLIDDIRSWVNQPTRLWKAMTMLALCLAIMSSIVFLLWALDVIVSYNLALLIVISFSLIFAIGGTIWIGSRLQEEEDQ
jgi:hypothetical protein